MWNVKSSNRIVGRKAKQQAHLRHMNALRNIKPTMNITEPQRFNFLEHKAKKLQTKKQRLQQIQYHNSLLVHRMITAPSYIDPGYVYLKNSLNSIVVRKREQSIEDENRKIVRRLQSATSKYSKNMFNRSIKQYEKTKANISFSKMDQFYDFEGFGKKNSVDLLTNKSQGRLSRPYSAKK